MMSLEDQRGKRVMAAIQAQTGRLIVIAAPSGAGKTSLTRALIGRLQALGHQAAFSVSYTTRSPRPGEHDGVDYHFVSPAQFDALREERGFLEWAEVFGRHYGTGRAVTLTALARSVFVFLDIDWQGARQVRETMPDSVHIFLKPPSLPELERRLHGRGQDDEATIAARMAQAQAEMAHADEFTHVLVNDDFERTLQTLQAIVLGQG